MGTLAATPCAVAAVLVAGAVVSSCAPPAERAEPSPRGAYLGQPRPGAEPQVFAPGIVSTGLYERDLTITPDGKELFFAVQGPGFSYGRIVTMRQRDDGSWGAPEMAPFSGPFPSWDLEPFVTPDGGRLLFASNRPREAGEEKAEDSDLFVVERTEGGWSTPVNLGEPISSAADEFFPAVTNDGTLYFTRADKGSPINRIYRSRLVNGSYAPPELLPEQVNTGRNRFNATVAADESFLILSAVGRDPSFGRSDYHVCFRNEDDSWSEPINLGERINSKDGFGYSPWVSHDGSYLFFMSARTTALKPLGGMAGSYGDLVRLHGEPGNGSSDIYWVNTSFLDALRPR